MLIVIPLINLAKGEPVEARILRLNIAGQPIEWLHWQDGVTLYARGLVEWSLGGIVKKVRGGKSRMTGLDSSLSLPAIMACNGQRMTKMRVDPPLTNSALFYRDNCQCLYCGQYFTFAELSRDHVHPSSKGGKDCWENVVAACKRCNQFKGDRLLKETSIELLALPYRPNPYEYMALTNSKRIRGDQYEYLRPQFSRYQGEGLIV